MVWKNLIFCSALITAPLVAQAEAFDIKKSDEYGSDILNVEVVSLEGKHWGNYKWDLSKTYIPIFLNKIQSVGTIAYEDWDLSIHNPDSDYKGLQVNIELINGEKLDPIIIFDGTVKTNNKVISEDPNRHLEYWFYGLNPTEANRKIVAKVLPIFTYKQCIETGNPIIHTSPEQCLMSNQRIFLNVPEKPTQTSLKVTNFDECLAQGEAIIDTFPRRCIVAGGYVFTEPPRILTPAPKKRTKKFKTEDFLKK